MGRNLWVEDITFSRDFTILVWDDFFDLFPHRPTPLNGPFLLDWVNEVRRRAKSAPILYQIWRKRADGSEESSAAWATSGPHKLQIEGCYDELTVREVPEFPSLHYHPPEWKGAELFDQVFRTAGLRLQAEPLAKFFDHELEQMEQLARHHQIPEYGIL